MHFNKFIVQIDKPEPLKVVWEDRHKYVTTTLDLHTSAALDRICQRQEISKSRLVQLMIRHCLKELGEEVSNGN